MLSLVKAQPSSPEVQGYITNAAPLTSKLLFAAVNSCITVGSPPRRPHVVIILKLAVGGIVQAAEADLRGDMVSCVKDHFVGAKYPAPPLNPFYLQIFVQVKR